MSGSRSSLVQHPLPEDDPKLRQPDITVARRELGWEPAVSLEDGLADTISYFRVQLTEATSQPGH